MHKIAAAAYALSDFMNCASGDLHLMHLQFRGEDFDTMHKKTLLKYYEAAADDYDELAEWAIALGADVQNPNLSAKRINYPDNTYKNVDRGTVVTDCDALMDQIVSGFGLLHLYSEKEDKNPALIGFDNYLQTRLEYWGKELLYFNDRRKASSEEVK